MLTIKAEIYEAIKERPGITFIELNKMFSRNVLLKKLYRLKFERKIKEKSEVIGNILFTYYWVKDIK
jgi:predicted transcriptional regulator